MNFFIQIGVAAENHNLRHALNEIRTIYHQADGYSVVYLGRLGKKVTKQWNKFENEKNWPVGSAEMIISQSGATASFLKAGEARTLVHISPLDENWAPSEQCLNTRAESRVAYNRSVIENIFKSKPSIEWSNIIEIGIAENKETGLENEVNNLHDTLQSKGVKMRFIVGDIVEPTAIPYFNGFDWRLSKLLVNLHRQQCINKYEDPEIEVAKGHQCSVASKI